MTIDTARLRLLPWAPEQLLTLIEEPERFEERFGAPVADGLHGFMVPDEVSPAWLAQLRAASGADPRVLGYALVDRSSGQVIGTASYVGPPGEKGEVSHPEDGTVWRRERR